MFDFTGLQALAFVLPVLGYPVLVIVGLLVETPILRREPATQRRRTGAAPLALSSLLAAVSAPVGGPPRWR